MSNLGAESDDQGPPSAPKPSKRKRLGTAMGDAFGDMAKEGAARSFAAADEAVSRSAGTEGYIPGARVDVKTIEMPQSYRRGGKVRKTGKARLHRGERMAKGGRYSGGRC